MLPLRRAQVDADLLLQRFVDAAQKMLEQHVFRRNGRIRLQLEDEMAVVALVRPQRRGGAVDRGGQAVLGGGDVHHLRRGSQVGP